MPGWAFDYSLINSQVVSLSLCRKLVVSFYVALFLLSFWTDHCRFGWACCSAAVISLLSLSLFFPVSLSIAFLFLPLLTLVFFPLLSLSILLPFEYLYGVLYSLFLHVLAS